MLSLPAISREVVERILDLEEEEEREAEILRVLSERNKLMKYKEFIEIQRESREFEDFFEKCTGFKPWSLQRTWARRILSGKSFSIVAPTGVGCLLYTSPSPRDLSTSRMPSSA